MALGPKQISASDVKAAEAVIDAAITKSIPGRPRVTVATSLLGSSARELWDALRQKYIDAGWKKAEWVSDQRDGDYIDLSA